MFPLTSVLIGCQSETTYNTIQTHLLGKQRGLLSKPGYSSMVVCCHEPLSEDLCRQIKLSAEDFKDVAVLSTAPFRRGYISSSTQIVTILVNREQLKSPEDFDNPCKPAIVSQFLTHYFDKTQTSVEKVTQSVQVLQVDEITKFCHTENMTDVDIHACIFIDIDLALCLNLMNGCWLNVKLCDGGKRKSRPMKVIISSHPTSAVLLSELTWLNLGAVMTSSRLVTLKRLTVKPCDGEHHETITSSSSTHDILCCSLAEKLTVARVNSCEYDGRDLTEDLQDFFKIDRYLRNGDVFRVGERDSTVLMKVIKVNGSSKSNTVHRVQRKITTLYQAAAVHSFLPHIPQTEVISRDFLSLQTKLLTLLKPFIREDWKPDPLSFILLAGPTGSGKTTLLQQIAETCHCNFLMVNSVHLIADSINSTETRIKDVLCKAQAVAPCLLLLRNIHLIAREEAMNVDNPRLADFFCKTLCDTLESSQWPVIVFGACERLNDVNDGIRELTLQELVVESPDLEERKLILEDLTSVLHCHPSVSLEYLAEHTAGFIFGDLRALTGQAERNAQVRANDISLHELGYICDETLDDCGIMITQDDFITALEYVQSVQSLDLGAPKIPHVQWADIGGLQSVKGDILDTIQLPLQHPELFTSGLRRSGILLYGPPGTGKTLLAKAVATECSLNFFSVKGPELINMYVGQSEENVRMVFSKARSATPCVIFFDELDSLAPNRGRAGDSGGVMDRVVSQLLAELDGLHKTCDVFIIGATNRPDLLDSALLRPGRFDKLVYVGMSSGPAELLTILRAVTRKFHLSSDCDLEQVARSCPSQLTGADVYSLCAEAMTNAIKRQIDAVESGENIDNCQVTVSLADFTLAVQELTPSLSMEEINRYEIVRAQFSKITADNVQDIQNKELLADNLDERDAVEVSTRGQRNNPLWMKARKGKVTASVAGTIFHMRSNSNPSRLVSQIMQTTDTDIGSLPAVKHGATYEEYARRHYETQNKVKVQEKGFVTHEKFKWLGASIDGLVMSDPQKLIEIKCPMIGIKEPGNANLKILASLRKSWFLEKHNGKLRLKRSHNYYAQCQIQMACTGIKTCDFYVYLTKNGLAIDTLTETLHYNEDYVNDVIEKCEKFYYAHLLEPEL